MDSRSFQFLKAVLGEDGAKALAKAAQRSLELEGALLPRSIMAWLGIVVRSDFEGQIPGLENTYLQFAKTEDRYSGSVAIGDDVYSFDRANLFHLGACVAVAIGADHQRVSPGLRDLDIQRLGKNIDTLAKARVAIAELQKRVLDPALGYKLSHEHHDLGAGQMVTKINAHGQDGAHVGAATFTHGPQGLKLGSVVVDDEHQRRGIASAMMAHAERQTGKKVVEHTQHTDEGAKLWSGNAAQPQFGKAAKSPNAGKEAPGPAHAATPPMGPLQATPPDPTQNSKGPVVSIKPKAPKLPTPSASTDVIQTGHGLKHPKVPSLKVTKAQAEAQCPACAGKQFKDDAFTGCVCFRVLAKAVKVTVLEDGYGLSFGTDWDRDAIFTLTESLGQK